MQSWEITIQVHTYKRAPGRGFLGSIVLPETVWELSEWIDFDSISACLIFAKCVKH